MTAVALNIYGNLERKSHINHGYMSLPYGVKWSHLPPFGQHFGVFTTIEHNLWTLRSRSAISDYIVCCQVDPDRTTNIGSWKHSQEAKFMGPTWGPPGSCRSQIGPMLAPWTFLSELLLYNMETFILLSQCICCNWTGGRRRQTISSQNTNRVTGIFRSKYIAEGTRQQIANVDQCHYK